jgi:hypothetical protein
VRDYEPQSVALPARGLCRRRVVGLLYGAATVPLFLPLYANARQSGRLPTIGFLGNSTPSIWSEFAAAFVQRLRESRPDRRQHGCNRSLCTGHFDEDFARSGPRQRPINDLKLTAVLGDHHRAHHNFHATYSLRPVAAIPWMNARCRKKNNRIIGSVPSTAMAISWSHEVP